MYLPIDREKALETLGGDFAIYQELAQMLASEAQENSAAIEAAIAAGDAKTAERLAHSLKGAAANMSAEPLREITWELEQLGRAGDLETARQRLGLLQERVIALSKFVAEEVRLVSS